MLLSRYYSGLLVALSITLSLNNKASGVEFNVPSTDGAFFAETFQNQITWAVNEDDVSWFKSTKEKYATQDVSVSSSRQDAGVFNADKALVLESPAMHYCVTSPRLPESGLVLKGHDEIVIQYEVRLQETLECGGAYLKLLHLTPELKLASVDDETPYVLMFGPDKCGESKVHLIFRIQNPQTLEWEEKHLAERPVPPTSDTKSHLYTLAITSRDNSFEIFIDQKSVSKGELLQSNNTTFSPAWIPSKTIPDPSDVKPSNWEDSPTIDDPLASKPSDWDEDAPRSISDSSATMPEDWLVDEQEQIPDPAAVKPEDWDDEDDGTWEAPVIDNPKCSAVVSGCGAWKPPMINNPSYKGIWHAPKIDNPAYKGEWAPQQIPNPEYFEEDSAANLLEPIGAVAVEVWTTNGGITFDNIWIGYSLTEAVDFATKTWKNRFDYEVSQESEAKESEQVKLRNELYKSGDVRKVFRAVVIDLSMFFAQSPTIFYTGCVALFMFLLYFYYSCCHRGRTFSHDDIKAKKDGKSDIKVDDNKSKESVSQSNTVRRRKKHSNNEQEE